MTEPEKVIAPTSRRGRTRGGFRWDRLSLGRQLEAHMARQRTPPRCSTAARPIIVEERDQFGHLGHLDRLAPRRRSAADYQADQHQPHPDIAAGPS